MARFRAYASDSSSDEDEVKTQREIKSRNPKKAEPEDEDSELSEQESYSSSSSSELRVEELIASPKRPSRKPKHPGNIFVDDDELEILDARVHISPPSSSSSSPSRPHPITNNNPTIIPWAQHVGVDAQKMHVMQASLFRVPEEAAALKALKQSQQNYKPPVSLRAPLQPLNRKHSRDSDGDGLKFDSRERASFAHDIDPPALRPSRKYARVEISSSIARGNESAVIDPGLSMGRSFRVSWGPGCTLVYLGSLCGPFSNPVLSANTSAVNVTKIIPCNSPTPPSFLGSANSPLDLSSKLLQFHLSHTPIMPDDAGIPFAYPSSGKNDCDTDQNLGALDFTAFSSLFPSTDVSGPAALFKLGSVLFDPIVLYLGKQRGAEDTSPITPDVRNNIFLLRRKIALGNWLEDVVKPSVDRDLRAKVTGNTAPSRPYTAADASFTYLTGHQVEQACLTAADGGYLKLSTLISQAGGDEGFKEDIRSQLGIWKSEKLGPASGPGGQGLVSRGVWKVYCLLSGLLGAEEDNLVDGEDIIGNLDWKRIFALCLWYGESLDASIANVVRAYENLLLQSSTGSLFQVARPSPPWLLEAKRVRKTGHYSPPNPSLSSSRHIAGTLPSEEPEDSLYALIKLHADPSLSLSHILDPRSFSPLGMDWGIGMCWHLYIILSRVMRVRDFSDRGDPGLWKAGAMMNGIRQGSSDDDNDNDSAIEGHSPSADLLASSYALELEGWGMVQEAAFVLLHLEGSIGREKAIKDLLSRSAPKLDEWMTRGVVGSLKIPMTWVDEAKATYALYQGNTFTAYELYLTAGLYNLAHDLAVLELAPDAVIRKDLDLLRELFIKFESEGKRDKIDGWFVRGKVFLDYIRVLTRIPELQDQLKGNNRSELHNTQEMEELTRLVPKIIGALPNILYRSRVNDPRHAAALEEMVKELLEALEMTNPTMLSQIQQPMLNMTSGAVKLDLIRGIGYSRFLQNIER